MQMNFQVLSFELLFNLLSQIYLAVAPRLGLSLLVVNYSSSRALPFLKPLLLCVSFHKQTKNRNETGSNLSLGTRLTVLSKRVGRKRCCDATPGRCLEVCRLTIFASHCLKNASFSSKDRGFWWDPRA